MTRCGPCSIRQTLTPPTQQAIDPRHTTVDTVLVRLLRRCSRGRISRPVHKSFGCFVGCVSYTSTVYVAACLYFLSMAVPRIQSGGPWDFRKQISVELLNFHPPPSYDVGPWIILRDYREIDTTRDQIGQPCQRTLINSASQNASPNPTVPPPQGSSRMTVALGQRIYLRT